MARLAAFSQNKYYDARNTCAHSVARTSTRRLTTTHTHTQMQHRASPSSDDVDILVVQHLLPHWGAPHAVQLGVAGGHRHVGGGDALRHAKQTNTCQTHSTPPM